MVRRRYMGGNRRRLAIKTRDRGYYPRGNLDNRQNLRLRIPRGLRLNMHHFKQTYQISMANFRDAGVAANGTYINAPNGIVYGPTVTALDSYFFALVFTLSDLPQVASFQAVFDSYRINKVTVKFIPLQNVSPLKSADTAGANQNGVNQDLETVIDYDDGNILTSRSAALEYDTYKVTPCYAKHVRTITPKMSMNAFKTSGTTIGYIQEAKQWIDAAYADVEHYGIKGCIPRYSINATQDIQSAWRVYATMYFSCRQVR